jgi:hypothetical protein
MESQTTNTSPTLKEEANEDGKDDDDAMQQDDNTTNDRPNDSPKMSSDSSSGGGISPSDQVQEPVEVSMEIPQASEEDQTTYHTPVHMFSTMLIELLIDQNSNLASLAQQAIVSVAYQLTNIANGDSLPENDSISPSFAQQLMDVEIVDGIINGLLSIAGRIKTALYDSNRGDNASQSSDGAPDSQYNTQKAVFQMNEDIDQGEINLCKMVSLSVSRLS